MNIENIILVTIWSFEPVLNTCLSSQGTAENRARADPGSVRQRPDLWIEGLFQASVELVHDRGGDENQPTLLFPVFKARSVIFIHEFGGMI